MDNLNSLSQLGKYQLIEKLGEGTFAEVYLATDPTLDNRPVALKILKPALLADQHFLQRFRREAGTMAKLSHPHIATIYGFDESRGKIFIAMQLARGFTLAEQISKSGAVPLPDALNLLRPICQALDYAHKQGVVHRDLKPANILIDGERGPLLTDFGLARLLSSNSTSLSMSSGIIGTHSYIALEVWEGNEATPAADIYALGCIVYELLTGQVLFTGPTPMAIMRAHDRRPQFDLALLSPDVIKVLQRALSPEPENRYATAETLWNALKSVVEQAEFAKPAKVAAEWQAETRRAIKAGEWRQAKMAVGRWLAITPNDPAALEAQAEIERGTTSKPAPYRPQTKTQPTSQPEPSSKRWQIAIVAALLIVVAGATGWLLRDQSGNPLPDGSIALTATAQAAASATQIALASTATDMPTPTRNPVLFTSTPKPPTPTSFTTLPDQPTNAPQPTLSLAVQLPNPGELRRDAKGVPMIFVPGGPFVMGSDDHGGITEQPAHVVKVGDFWIDQTEVTIAQYAECAAAGGCTEPSSRSSDTRDSYYNNPEYANYPVIHVSWGQAQTYCVWRGGRLPTEAEWEKAARGVDERTYPWGEDISCNQANYSDCIGDTTTVGSYPDATSPYGALDMAGNVWEWTKSEYKDYPYKADDGRENIQKTNSLRVLRGGSWFSDMKSVRAIDRFNFNPSSTLNNVGFRCIQPFSS